MNIGSVGSYSPVGSTAAAAKPEAMEGAGPDRDGDSDDIAAAATSAPKGSATAPGVGAKVDVFA
jgi:hypothetical protein